MYPKGKVGRPPYLLETMLRTDFMQQWFALSDRALEESLYDIQPMRQFARLLLAHGRLPDETTILNFRHLLKRNGLATRPRVDVKTMFCERDPKMRQAKKGNNWHFGMMAHIGAKAESEQLTTLFALSNLCMVRQRLMSATG